MSMEETLQAMLSSQLTAGVWPIVPAQGVDYPHVTYQGVYSATNNVLTGAPPINQTRLQIDVWSRTYAEAKSIANQITTAMQGWSVQNWQIGTQDLFESAVHIYRVKMDFSIWHYD